MFNIVLGYLLVYFVITKDMFPHFRLASTIHFVSSLSHLQTWKRFSSKSHWKYSHWESIYVVLSVCTDRHHPVSHSCILIRIAIWSMLQGMSLNSNSKKNSYTIGSIILLLLVIYWKNVRKHNEGYLSCSRKDGRCRWSADQLCHAQISTRGIKVVIRKWDPDVSACIDETRTNHIDLKRLFAYAVRLTKGWWDSSTSAVAVT